MGQTDSELNRRNELIKRKIIIPREINCEPSPLLDKKLSIGVSVIIVYDINMESDIGMRFVDEYDKYIDSQIKDEVEGYIDSIERMANFKTLDKNGKTEFYKNLLNELLKKLFTNHDDEDVKESFLKKHLFEEHEDPNLVKIASATIGVLRSRNIFEPMSDAEFVNLFESYCDKKELIGLVGSDFLLKYDKGELTQSEFESSEVYSSWVFVKEYNEKLKYLRKEIEDSQDSYHGDNNRNLNIRQIALICQYENIPITEKVADEKLKEFGIKTSITSGKQLATKYRKFNTPNQRTAEGVQTANDIRIILPYLSPTAKIKAERELEVAVKNQSKKKED